MRISAVFNSFLIITCSVILILLPITLGIYDFRTDLREDEFVVTTTPGTTTATVQLFKAIYEDDVSTIDIYSDNTTDIPLYSSYNGTTRALGVSGLSDNTTRTLTATYDIDAIGVGGISGLLAVLPWIWIIIWVAFPIAGLIAIWSGKD